MLSFLLAFLMVVRVFVCPQPHRHCPRIACPSPTAWGAQAEAVPTSLGCVGSVVLGPAATTLVPLGRSAHHCEPRHRRRLASRRFQLYWRWRSRRRGSQQRISEEICVLIRRLAQGSPDWGAPKIHGELQTLGFAVSERSVARYLHRIVRRGDPAKKGLAFLRNQREAIVGSDLFTCQRRRSECCIAFS